MNRTLIALLAASGLAFSSVGFANVNDMNNNTTSQTSQPSQTQGTAEVQHDKYYKVTFEDSDGNNISAIVPSKEARDLQKGDNLKVINEVEEASYDEDKGWF